MQRLYNLLKLTEHLFEWKPEAAYGDYYERALYNQILASQEPKSGNVQLFPDAQATGHFRTYSTPDGFLLVLRRTGMENHTKYGEAIYFHGANDLYVNLFIPSVSRVAAEGTPARAADRLPAWRYDHAYVPGCSHDAAVAAGALPGWAAGPLAS